MALPGLQTQLTDKTGQMLACIGRQAILLDGHAPRRVCVALLRRARPGGLSLVASPTRAAGQLDPALAAGSPSQGGGSSLDGRGQRLRHSATVSRRP